jgi:hypothetical protein
MGFRKLKSPKKANVLQENAESISTKNFAEISK